MGQKVSPISFRIGVGKGWRSRWFAENDNYRKMLAEDIKLREALTDKLRLAGVQSIDIERLPRALSLKIRVSRPGVVIGRGGSGIEEVKKFVVQNLGHKDEAQVPKIDILVEEIKNPELSSRLVAQRIVAELERRMPHRRVVNRAMDRVMAAGAKGVKVALSGRIGGAEISRTEKYKRGAVPTQTLRANIDYASTPALLKKGYVGIKVWINKEEKEE